MGNAASSSIKFAIPLFSQTPPDTLLETDDQFFTHRTTITSLRTQTRGTERPPSESLRTKGSLKQDQLDHKELTQDSFDCLIELLRNSYPTGLPIQPSSTVDTKPFDYAFSDFVAPLYHHKTGHWTVLCVSSQGQRKEHPGKSVVTAQHYDPDPRQHKGRHTEVGDKIRSWVEQCGSDVELRFTREAGPTIQPSDQNVTGVYAVMGALDFSARLPLLSKDSFWSGDYVKKIKAALHATQPRYPTPERTPARRGSSISSADNGAEGMRTPARTRKNGAPNAWETPSYEEMDIFGNKTPIAGNPKRRRLDTADAMPFDVKEHLGKATSSILNLGLPSVTNLQQELDERHKECSEHNKVVEKKKFELEECQAKRASRVRKHDMIVTDFKRLGDDIAAREKAAEEDLAAIPPLTRKFNFPMPQSLAELYRERFEENIKPQRQRHEELGIEKLEASEMLKSAEEDFTMREKEVEQAEVEMGVTEERVKTAYMRREFVEMQERHLEDQRAFLSRVEAANGRSSSISGQRRCSHVIGFR
ncbi:hypothetical protein LB504_001365 [Fusarium proliferatum]|nr:hypothetical protein LB504_001365 [Fusarium proliferatum]